MVVSDRGLPSVPFVGLAEGMVLAAIRREGVPLQRVRPALEVLKRDIGIDYALASKRLYTDGAELLYDYAAGRSSEEAEAVHELVVVRSGQRVFSEVIKDLPQPDRVRPRRLREDHHTSSVTSERRSSQNPTRGFGQPIFSHGGVRVSDVLDRFWSGDDINTLSSEFGVQEHEIEDVLRPHPDGPPDLFLDRSLGRITVPRLLREFGLRLITSAERYGIPDDERVTDEQWLAEAGQLGEVVLMKDSRVRYNEAEKQAVQRFGVRCFCLTRQDLRGDEMAQWFIENLDHIALACQTEGPFVYAVQEARIDRLL